MVAVQAKAVRGDEEVLNERVPHVNGKHVTQGVATTAYEAISLITHFGTKEVLLAADDMDLTSCVTTVQNPDLATLLREHEALEARFATCLDNLVPLQGNQSRITLIDITVRLGTDARHDTAYTRFQLTGIINENELSTKE